MYTKRAVESQRVLLASLFFSVICPEETVRDGSYRWWSEWRSSDTAFGEISTSFSQKFIGWKRRKCMPRNKRESLIYTVLMCFTMVLWMSIYNVTLHMGALNLTTIREAWIGFPIAYVFAMCMDWFVVSGPAKGFAFRFLVKPESPVLHKVIAVSCSMVVPMVIIMSLYGALEGCVKGGNFSPLLLIWLTNIPKNFVMALPFQLIIAGPLVRKVFRGAFPEGTVLA